MMKNYLPLAIAVLLGLSSCKKETANVDAGIVGTWYENKLMLHTSLATGGSHDTTFTAEAFNKYDYYQFASDKKAVFSQSGMYGYNGKAAIWGLAGGAISHFTWSIADSTLTLNNTDRNTSTEYLAGPTYTEQAIIQLDANHLVLRTQFFSPGPYNLTTTSYFNKGN